MWTTPVKLAIAAALLYVGTRSLVRGVSESRRLLRAKRRVMATVVAIHEEPDGSGKGVVYRTELEFTLDARIQRVRSQFTFEPESSPPLGTQLRVAVDPAKLDELVEYWASNPWFLPLVMAMVAIFGLFWGLFLGITTLVVR